MAIPTFTGQEPEKCLDWINRIRNICSQAGCPLQQELMNKSEPVVQNFIGNMREDWTDEEVIVKGYIRQSKANIQKVLEVCV